MEEIRSSYRRFLKHCGADDGYCGDDEKPDVVNDEYKALILFIVFTIVISLLIYLICYCVQKNMSE